ncbi:hypothetical protein ACET3X_007738 [Alternaria dauci]|uniref:Rhodopsin domain-containing protein n=1 Tax=Alternaria dauci TaxID=48095 RepID=A0ABR3UCS4_9PLEO
MSNQPIPGAEPLFFGNIEIDITEFDFSNLSSRLGTVTITCTVSIILVVLTVALRIYSRARYVKHIFLDDVLIIFAAVLTVALAGMAIAATRYGIGQHVWLLSIATLFDTLKICIRYLIICQILYSFAITLTKIAIISQYLRFIQERAFRTKMYVISIIIVGHFITAILVTVFQCRPVRGVWDFTVEPTCLDFVTYLYASSAVNVATDLLLLVLPLSHLWKLNLPKKQRFILCVLLAGGASACIVGIARIAYLHQLHGLDLTYESVICLVLTVGECTLGITFISIAALRPMARQFFPKAMRNSPSSSAQARAWPVRLHDIQPARTVISSTTCAARSPPSYTFSQDMEQYPSESKQNLSESYEMRSGESC